MEGNSASLLRQYSDECAHPDSLVFLLNDRPNINAIKFECYALSALKGGSCTRVSVMCNANTLLVLVNTNVSAVQCQRNVVVMHDHAIEVHYLVLVVYILCQCNVVFVHYNMSVHYNVTAMQRWCMMMSVKHNMSVQHNDYHYCC